MRRTLWIVIILVLFGLVVAMRLVQQNRHARALVQMRQAQAQAPTRVEVAVATVRDIATTYQALGTLQSTLQVKIAPKVTGRVIYLQGEEGDRVTRGEVLARLDSDEVNANVRQGQAAMREAQWRLAQAQTTTGATDVSVSTQIGQQTAAVASARANYEQLRHSEASQNAAAQAAVRQAQGHVDSAEAQIRSARDNLASADANRDNAVIQYNRTYSLYSQGFSAAQDVDNAKAQARVQEAAVGAAQGGLTNAVGARDTALGERRAAQEQLRITIAKSAADVETARQSLAQAQEALRLAKANRAQSPAYRQGLAALQATVQDAREALAAAVARQADTVLTSPIDGFVTQRLVDPGTTVTSGQTLLMLEAFGDIWVTFAVPAEVATVLRKGQQVQAAFASLLGRVLPARIGQINPSAESQGRQFTVRAIMDNRQGLLKPGMFARVTATTAMAPRAVSVPPEALRTTRTGPTVIVVDTANVAHLRPVQTGLANGNYLAITGGLQPGEQVIVLGGERVRDGQRVAPQRRQPGQQPAPAASVTTTRTY